MSTRILVFAGAFFIAAIAIYYLIDDKPYKFVDKLTNKNILDDTIYFKLTDRTGNKSMIHDSGIKPSLLKGIDKITMKVVKYEYNDGIESLLDKPVEIAIGQNIFNLAKIIKLGGDDIQDKSNHYVLTIKNPWK